MRRFAALSRLAILLLVGCAGSHSSSLTPQGTGNRVSPAFSVRTSASAPAVADSYSGDYYTVPHTFTWPKGAPQRGDLEIAQVLTQHYRLPGTPTDTSGNPWIAIDGPKAGTSVNEGTALYYKIAGSSEPAEVTFNYSTGSAAYVTVNMVRISNSNGVAPLFAYTNSTTTTLTHSGLTPSYLGQLPLELNAWVSTSLGSITAGPAGWTELTPHCYSSNYSAAIFTDGLTTQTNTPLSDMYTFGAGVTAIDSYQLLVEPNKEPTPTPAPTLTPTPTWGVGYYANMNNDEGAGTALYIQCNSNVYTLGTYAPAFCSYGNYQNPTPPFYLYGTKSLSTSENFVAIICPLETAYCASDTIMTTAIAQFNATESVSILPLAGDTLATYAALETAQWSTDTMHITSASLPTGTPVSIQITADESASYFNLACGSSLNESSTLYTYTAGVTLTDGLSASATLTGNCVGSKFVQSPGTSNTAVYEYGTVGSAVPIQATLIIFPAISDCVYVDTACGIQFSESGVTGFVATEHFKSLTPGVTLTFDSGSTYQ